MTKVNIEQNVIHNFQTAIQLIALRNALCRDHWKWWNENSSVGKTEMHTSADGKDGGIVNSAASIQAKF